MKRKSEILMPSQVCQLIERLNRAGYAAYSVGGCVRDSLLGIPPQDWDVCTNALPGQVEAVFREEKRLAVGIKHGTVTVFLGGVPYEITTFRKESAYSDHRHPDSVEFVSDLKEDLARRDFTVNAMAYHPEEGLMDYFCGLEDLSKGILRCVGTAEKRFREDALRMMRALRFASVYGFSIEPKTARAIRSCRWLLDAVAKERLRSELDRMVCGKAAPQIMREFPEVLFTLIPELAPSEGFDQHNRFHAYDVWEHTLRSIAASPDDLVIRLTLLLHDVGKPFCMTRDENGTGHFYGHPALGARMTGEILRRLRYDRATIVSVEELVAQHCRQLEPREKPMRRALNQLGEERLKQLLQVRRADVSAQAPFVVDERVAAVDDLENCLQKVLAQGNCFTVKKLAINGSDLLALGMQPGPRVGMILNALLESVIEGDVQNEKDALMREAGKRWLSQ